MKRKLYFYICVVICCCFVLSNISMVEGGVEEEYIPSTTSEEKTVHEYYFNSELGVNIEEKSCEGKNSNEGDKGIFDKIWDSAVLVGIITALFSLMRHNNTNSLKYITEERQKWREKIRDIAKNIEAYQYSSDDKDKQKLREILVELKVNINPYGKENDTAYMEDGHIWAVIRNLEKPQKISNEPNQSNKQEMNDKEEFVRDKNKLIDYLSYLLKYDWERAKYEVEKKSRWFKINCFWIVSMVLLGGVVGFYIQKEPCDVSCICCKSDTYLLCLIIIAWLTEFVCFCCEEKSSERKKHMKELTGIGAIVFLVTILIVKCYFIYIKDKQLLFFSVQKNWSCMIDTLMLILIIVVLIYCKILYSDYINDKEETEQNYKDIIEK